MMEWAINQDHPVFIRYPRGETENLESEEHTINPTLPKFIHQSSNPKILISTTGIATQIIVNAMEKNTSIFYEVDVVHFPAVKSQNEEVDVITQNYEHCITIEDGSIIGGFGQYLKYQWERSSTKKINTKFHHLGIQDHFPAHGSISELQKEEGFDVDSVLTKLNQLLINS